MWKHGKVDAMYRAVKIRIYPTDEQESYLAQCFGNTRWLWNYMLNATTIVISNKYETRFLHNKHE